MKKFYLLLIIFVFSGFLVFGNDIEQEEVDFLIFLPDSSNHFVDEKQAMEHLDDVAKYLKGRNLSSGQIHVDGYTAEAVSAYDLTDLSRARALFVINELHKRGVPDHLFSDPEAFGGVHLWGDNTNENERSPNRRVRIFLDGDLLTTDTLEAADSGNITSNTEYIYVHHMRPERSNPKIFCILLLLLIIIALIIAFTILALKYLKNKNAVKSNKSLSKNKKAPGFIIINLEEEIRRRAYELYLDRGGVNGKTDRDWYIAVFEICAKYEAVGYHTGIKDGYWRAYR
jgi:hypothetical protein